MLSLRIYSPTVKPLSVTQRNNNHRLPSTGALARILFVGDVVGPLGMEIVEALLPGLRAAQELDFVIANGENCVENGAGIDLTTARRLLAAGVDVITTGNHAHDADASDELYHSGLPVIRPDNLPGSNVGQPYLTVERYGLSLGVANVIGGKDGHVSDRVVEDIKQALRPLAGNADVMVLDIHASWPAEKLAIATLLDGQVGAVVGTHTHVPTADAQILDGGTAYITDVGMTGARDSVIGFRPEEMVKQLGDAAQHLPLPATLGDGVLNAVLITAAIDGRALSINPLTMNHERSRRTPTAHHTPTAIASPATADGPLVPASAAIFDCDGLLVDSAPAWRRAYERVLADQHRHLDPDIPTRLNGASVQVAASALEVDADDLYKALVATFREHRFTALAGARALLSSINRRIPTAIATNAPIELVELALGSAGLSTSMPIVSADRMRGKPAPDVYLAACALLEVTPEDAVALEDSPIGAAAAKAAGLRLVYVPSPGQAAVGSDLTVNRLDDSQVLALLGIVDGHHRRPVLEDRHRWPERR